MNTFLLHLQPFRIHKAFVAPLWGVARKSHAETPLQCDQYEGASNVPESSTPQEIEAPLPGIDIGSYCASSPSSSIFIRMPYSNNNNNNKQQTTTIAPTTNILSLYTPIAKSPDKHHLSFGTVIGSSRVASSKGKTWAPLRGAKWISPFKCLGLKIWKRWRFWCTVMQNEPQKEHQHECTLYNEFMIQGGVVKVDLQYLFVSFGMYSSRGFC